MKTSEHLNELAAALAKAQCAFEAAERGHVAKVTSKKGEGSSYSFNYADLAAYLDVCRQPLGENGLSFVQIPTTNVRFVSVVTLLMHSSGQFIESDPLTLEINVGEGGITPQAVGSAVTYARRYSLSALIGMASEADDDGNAASGNNAQTAPREALPECPECKTNKSVIVGRPEYGGGYVCFGKKGGCGHKWQAVKELAEQSGMTTGDKIPPTNGKHDDDEEIKAYNDFHYWFSAIWTGDAYDKLKQKLDRDTAGKPYRDSLLEKLRIGMERALWRTNLEMASSIGDDAFEDVVKDIRKTPPLAGEKPYRDVVAFCEWALSANPSPFNDKQQRLLLKELERLQSKHV